MWYQDRPSGSPRAARHHRRPPPPGQGRPTRHSRRGRGQGRSRVKSIAAGSVPRGVDHLVGARVVADQLADHLHRRAPGVGPGAAGQQFRSRSRSGSARSASRPGPPPSAPAAHRAHRRGRAAQGRVRITGGSPSGDGRYQPLMRRPGRCFRPPARKQDHAARPARCPAGRPPPARSWSSAAWRRPPPAASGPGGRAGPGPLRQRRGTPSRSRPGRGRRGGTAGCAVQFQLPSEIRA